MRRPSVIFLLAIILGIKLADTSIYSTSVLLLVLFLLTSSFVLKYQPKKWLYLFLGIAIAFTHTTYLKNNLQNQSRSMSENATEKGLVQVSGILYQKNYLDQKQSWIQLDTGGKCKLQFSSYKTFPKLDSGVKVLLSGKFTKASPARNPNGFDEKKWLYSKKAFGTIAVEKIEVIKGTGDPIESLRYKLIKPVVESLLYHTALKQGPLAAGMLFGEDGWIEADVLDAFSTAGVNHILSVSGAHFAVLLFWIYYLLDFKECSFWLKKVTAWSILGIFIWLIGMDVAALRAYVMFVLLDVMRIQYKQSDGLNALSLTIVIMLIMNPYSASDIGLQLAASAMYAIVVIAPFTGALGFQKIQRLLKTEEIDPPVKKWLFKQLSAVVQAVNVSLSVTIVLYPILRNQFNQFSFLSILYNIPVSLISAISLPASVLCCILSPIQFLARGAGLINGLLLKSMSLIVQTSENLPHQNHLPSLSSLQTFIFYGILLMPMYFKTFENGILALKVEKTAMAIKKYIGMGSLAILLLTINLLPTMSFSNQLRIYYLDVGQGDGSVIITPDKKVILMDTGLKKGSLKVGDSLLKLGIDHIDLMILTHPHDDHIGGAPDILSMMPVKELAVFKGHYSPEETAALNVILQLAQSHRTKILYWGKGVTDDLSSKEGNLNIRVLHPPEGFDSDNANDESLVCEIIYQKTSFLFTGDISTSVECDIINQVKGNALVLKVPHHGSGSSSGDELLSLPIQLAVIQVGQNNRYGHPNDKALSRIKMEAIPIFRTDKQGCISISTDGEQLIYKSQIQEE